MNDRELAAFGAEAFVKACAKCDVLDAEPETDGIGWLKAQLLARPEGRVALRRARHCRQCGVHVHGAEARRRCPAATCTIWSCPNCGLDRGSAGPIDCKACNSPWWARLLRAPATAWYWLAGKFQFGRRGTGR